MNEAKRPAHRPTIYTKELGYSVIYSLSDESGIKYIGQTRLPNRRFAQHCSLSNNRGSKKVNKWLYEIIQKNEKPIIDIVEFTDNLDEREIYWIDYYRKEGRDLLNMTNGGKDISYINRAKSLMPWGKTLAPVQRRLMSIKLAINFFRRNNNIERAEHFDKRLCEINDKIKRVGLLEMNNRIWLKYGE